jgi:hypothetical protein
MTPDSITIDGVTITRHIWELTSLMLASSNDSPFPYTWEEFVAANTKPEHYDGEPCDLPIIYGELPTGQRLVYTGECRPIRYEEPETWHDARPNYPGACLGYASEEPRWILRAVPDKPEPKPDQKPEHLHGEICTAPKFNTMDAAEFDGFIFKFTGERRKASYREFCLQIDHIIRWPTDSESACEYWILTREPAKPTQRYEVGDWVVLAGKPFQIQKALPIGKTWLYCDGNSEWYCEVDLHAATREDFMVEIKTKRCDVVRVWMENNNGETMGRVRGDAYGGGWTLSEWEYNIWGMAGIMFMPERFWKEK